MTWDGIYVSSTCVQRQTEHLVSWGGLYPCPRDVKEAAYKRLVRLVLEYGSFVWDPQGVVIQEEIEKLQKRAVMFVTSNICFETVSMTWILEQIKMGVYEKKEERR